MRPSEKHSKWQRIMQNTEVLRMPRNSLATFGPTALNYYCLSALGESSTRVRRGVVTAQKPQIILPGHLRHMFEGFETEAKEFAEELLERVGEQLRALGYSFKNELAETITQEKTFKAALDLVDGKIADANRTGVLRGPDAYWEISLAKFTIDMAAQSFPVNVSDLDRRGLFSEEGQLKHQIEMLFYKAGKDQAQIPILAEFLRSNRVFEEYEDRFFALAQRRPPSQA